MFDILHIVGNGSITLLGTSKVLAMGHDPSAQRRCIRLLKSSPCITRCGGGRDKLHWGGIYEPNNCIEKQLVLSKPENMVRIWGGGCNIGQSYHCRMTRL